MPGTGPSEPPLVRAANIFVIVALVAMIAGAIFIIGARATTVVDLRANEEATLLRHEVPAWETLGHTLQVKVLSPGNFTLAHEREGHPDEVLIRIEETRSGERVTDTGNETRHVGDAIWTQRAEPGQTWVVIVSNHGADLARVSVVVSSVTGYVVGGVLVTIGVLGFVAYRLGMRSSHA